MSHSCPQCGAVVDLPPERLADVCAFCETPLVRSEARGITIDSAAPFEVEKSVALTRMTHHLQGKFWAPREIRRIQAPEKLQGVLVPFWVYDGVCRSEYEARIGVYWYRKETFTKLVNGKQETDTRQVRETEWFNLQGSHAANFEEHLASGSKGLPEDESNELEPFDLGKAYPYDPARVAGWVAEHPTIDKEAACQEIAQELRQEENDAIRAFLPGDEVRDVRNTTDVTVSDVRLVLLPVWIAAFRYRDKAFRLLVNGQTGVVVGKVPRSAVKIAIAVLMTLIVIAGIVAGIYFSGVGGGR